MLGSDLQGEDFAKKGWLIWIYLEMILLSYIDCSGISEHVDGWCPRGSRARRRVHCLNLESMDIYMLIERQYPLSAEICKAMLDKKLQGGKPDENCYKMLKMMEKQAGVAMDEEQSLWELAFFRYQEDSMNGWSWPIWLKNKFKLLTRQSPQYSYQRKMDKCFKGTESFIAVYINDILVFSKNEKDNGLVLSPTKMKIAVSTVDFLGAVIGEGTIKLQHISSLEIVNFNEDELRQRKD
ncbi:hypothetical protein Tco_0278118 [Tanacetum coccineum]